MLNSFGASSTIFTGASYFAADAVEREVANLQRSGVGCRGREGTRTRANNSDGRRRA